MSLLRNSLAGMGLLAVSVLAAGCTSDHRSDDYYRERPSVTDLNSRDRGLQSVEVVEASDKLVKQILALPEVTSTPRRMTVVFTSLDDQTRSRQFNYDIFLERLKTNIAEEGRDRIAIVSNRDTFYRTRDRELDPIRGERDDFGQTGRRPGPAAGAPAANRIQPDFALTGKVMELANRGTSYYLFTFTLADIRSDGGGTEIPLRYEVRVRR